MKKIKIATALALSFGILASGSIVSMPSAMAASVQDTRVKVQDTTQFPYSAVVALDFKTADGKFYRGTGAMVGPKTFVTAAHCVTDGVIDMTVVPGLNKSKTPFGTAQIKQVHINPEYIRKKQVVDDWAVVNIDKPLGEKTGWFTPTTSSMYNKKFTTSGYPGDKSSGTMWTDSGIFRNWNDNSFTNELFTFTGQSGSPVYDLTGKMYGILNSVDRHDNSGKGTCITPEIIKAIDTMKKQ